MNCGYDNVVVRYVIYCICTEWQSSLSMNSDYSGFELISDSSLGWSHSTFLEASQFSVGFLANGIEPGCERSRPPPSGQSSPPGLRSGVRSRSAVTARNCAGNAETPPVGANPVDGLVHSHGAIDAAVLSREDASVLREQLVHDISWLHLRLFSYLLLTVQSFELLLAAPVLRSLLPPWSSLTSWTFLALFVARLMFSVVTELAATADVGGRDRIVRSAPALSILLLWSVFDLLFLPPTVS